MTINSNDYAMHFGLICLIFPSTPSTSCCWVNGLETELLPWANYIRRPHSASGTLKGFRQQTSLIFLSSHHPIMVPVRVFTEKTLSFLFLS